MVPVVVRWILSINDKSERAAVTRTNMAGDSHRQFGIICRVACPKYHREKMEAKLTPQMKGLGDPGIHHEWAIDLLKDVDGNVSCLTSCRDCRRNCLTFLEFPSGGKPADLPVCLHCANWDLMSPLMSYSPGEHYPARGNPNCPVDYPEKRKPGMIELEPMRLTFAIMLAACRATFYNWTVEKSASRKRKRRGEGGEGGGDEPVTKPWKQCKGFEYLCSCGVNGATMQALWEASQQHKKMTPKPPLDYESNFTIGFFAFLQHGMVIWRYATTLRRPNICSCLGLKKQTTN